MVKRPDKLPAELIQRIAEAASVTKTNVKEHNLITGITIDKRASFGATYTAGTNPRYVIEGVVYSNVQSIVDDYGLVNKGIAQNRIKSKHDKWKAWKKFTRELVE